MRLKALGKGISHAMSLPIFIACGMAVIPSVSSADTATIAFGQELEAPQYCDGDPWCFQYGGQKYDSSCSYLVMSLGNPLWGADSTRLYGKAWFRSADEYSMYNPYNEPFQAISPMAVNGIDDWLPDGEETLFRERMGYCAGETMALAELYRPDLSLTVTTTGPLFNAVFGAPSCENFPGDMANYRKTNVTVREAGTATETTQSVWVGSRCYANLQSVNVNYSLVSDRTHTDAVESSNGLTARVVNIPNAYALQAGNSQSEPLYDSTGAFITNIFAARNYSEANSAAAGGCALPCIPIEMRDEYQAQADYEDGIAYGDRVYDEADVSWRQGVILRLDMNTAGIPGAESVRYGFGTERVWGNPTVWTEAGKQELTMQYGSSIVPWFFSRGPVSRFTTAASWGDAVPVGTPFVMTFDDGRYTQRLTGYAEVLNANGDVIATRTVTLPFIRPVEVRNACFEAYGGGCGTNYGSYGAPGY